MILFRADNIRKELIFYRYYSLSFSFFFLGRPLLKKAYLGSAISNRIVLFPQVNTHRLRSDGQIFDLTS